MYRKPLTLLLMAGMMLALSACTGNNSENPAAEPPAAEEPIEQPSPSPAKETPVTEEAAPEGPVRYEDLPATKELQVTVEGTTESLPAVLTRSELGYAIYVLEDFEFTPEEPNQDIVFHQTSTDNFMRIEPLPAETNVEELRQSAEETLRAVSEEIVDLKESFIDETLRTKAEFILQAANGNSTLEMIGMRIGDKLFRFTLFLPKGESSEGIAQQFYPMIRSVVSIEP